MSNPDAIKKVRILAKKLKIGGVFIETKFQPIGKKIPIPPERPITAAELTNPLRSESFGKKEKTFDADTHEGEGEQKYF